MELKKSPPLKLNLREPSIRALWSTVSRRSLKLIGSQPWSLIKHTDYKLSVHVGGVHVCRSLCAFIVVGNWWSLDPYDYCVCVRVHSGYQVFPRVLTHRPPSCASPCLFLMEAAQSEAAGQVVDSALTWTDQENVSLFKCFWIISLLFDLFLWFISWNFILNTSWSFNNRFDMHEC